METFHYSIEIGDPSGSRFEVVEALVDTGATFTVMPTSVLRRLGVEPLRRGTFELADGRRIEMDVGRTWVKIDGQQEITLVIFGGDGDVPLIGAYTLKGLLLGVDPAGHRLVPMSGLLMYMSLKVNDDTP